MGSETALRGAVRAHLGPYGRVVRIESPIEPGTPDIAWCLRLGALGATGWMELKHLQSWPVRPDTAVTLPHPDRIREQARWASAWEQASPAGRSPLLLQVANDYLLFPGIMIADLFLDRPRNRADLCIAAMATGTGHFPTAAIIKALVRG